MARITGAGHAEPSRLKRYPRFINWLTGLQNADLEVAEAAIKQACNPMNPKHLLVVLSAVILLSDVLLFFRGSNTRVSSVVLLVNLLVVAAFWRYRLHIFVKSGQNTGSASHRFLLTIVFWIVVAVALFFGFKTFQ